MPSSVQNARHERPGVVYTHRDCAFSLFRFGNHLASIQAITDVLFLWEIYDVKCRPATYFLNPYFLLEMFYTSVEHLSLNNRPIAVLFLSRVVIYQASEYTCVKRNLSFAGNLPSINSCVISMLCRCVKHKKFPFETNRRKNVRILS